MTGEAPQLVPGAGRSLAQQRALDASVARRRLEQQTSILNVFEAAEARETSPDLEARVGRMAQRLGVPRVQVPEDPAILDRLERQQDLRSLLIRFPRLHTAMQDVPRVRMMTDDLGNLKTVAGTFDWFARNYDAGAMTNEAGRLGAASAFRDLTPAEQDRLREIDELQAQADEESSWLGQAVNLFGQMAAPTARSFAVGGAAAAAGSLAGPAGAGAGFVWGTGAAMFGQSALTEFGNQYRQQLQQLLDAGVPLEEARETAWLTAGVYGLGAGALELVGVKYAAAPFRAAGKELAARFLAQGTKKLTRETATSALQTFLVEYAKSVGAEVGTETMQEALAVISERVAAGVAGVETDSGDLVGRFADVAWKAFQGMSVLGLFGPAAHYASDLHRVHGAQVFSRKLEKDAEAAAASKLRERDPDGYRAVVDAMAAGQPGAEVYVDARKLDEAIEKSGESREGFAQAMPDVAAQLEQAKKTPGADVRMTIGQWNAHVATSGLFEQLRPHVRAGENALSEAEAQELRQFQERYRDDAIARAEFSQNAREEFEASAAKVERRIKEQLSATGKMDHKSAIAAAKLHRTFVETQAAKLEITPEEFDQRYPLRVQAERRTLDLPDDPLFHQDGTLRTDTPEFREWFGESQAVDEQGAPLRVFHATTRDFAAFDPAKLGSATGHSSARLGFYFSTDPQVANLFTSEVDQSTWPRKVGQATGARTLPVYLSIRNPKAMTVEEFLSETRPSRKDLEAQGFDGIRVLADADYAEKLGGEEYEADAWVAFSPEQIKSVNNRGTWDPNNPNILEQQAAPADFYSALAREIEALPTKASTVLGWKQAITGLVNKGKIKKEELDWTGLLDWLDATQRMQEVGFLAASKVGKDEVLEFLNGNGIQVETVQLGGRVQDRTFRVEPDGMMWRVVDQDGVVVIQGIATEETARDSARAMQEDLGHPQAQRTKYGRYTIPGGENYREVLLTLPEQPVNDYDAYRRTLEQKYGVGFSSEDITAEERSHLESLWGRAQTPGASQNQAFLSAHWSHRNVVAHIRLNDRMDSEGKRVLFVEEIQSDWAQAGRKKGFRLPPLADSDVETRFVAPTIPEGHDPSNYPGYWEAYDKRTGNLITRGPTEPAVRALAKGLGPRENDSGVPRAPFVESTKGWLNLALKKILMLAVEGGYDRVAFVNGEQSAARYDLSKQVSAIDVDPAGTLEPGRLVTVFTRGGSDIYLNVDEAGKVYESSHAEFDGEDLADVVGKEMADRIMAVTRPFPEPVLQAAIAGGMSEDQARADILHLMREPLDTEQRPTMEQWARLTKAVGDAVDLNVVFHGTEINRTRLVGHDLEVGGAGMKAFYDKIVPQAVQKLAPKLGGKVDRVSITEGAPREPYIVSDSTGFLVAGFGADLGPFGSQAEAEATMRAELTARASVAAQQVAIEITEKMRTAVQQGLPLFAEGREGRRGSFDPSTWTAMLYEKADASTFLHESAHYYLSVYSDMAAREGAPESVQRDMQQLLGWFGVKDLATWRAMSVEEQRQHHEKFAYSFEAYLHTGKAPSMALQGWFDKFAAWLRNVYRKVRDELNAIYRREFGTDLPILTGEVRQVMDRMLASEEAIEHAGNVRGLQPIHTEKPEGWSDEQWADYQARADRAREAGASSLATDALRGVPWLSTVPQELRREAAERRAEVRQEVERQVALEPVYRALRWLRHGLLVADDGTETPVEGTHKLATEAVRALLPEGRKLTEIGGGRYGVTTPEGLDPDVVAEMLRFPGGRALVEALLKAPAFSEAVDRRTDERMLHEHAEFVSAEEVEAAVERALFTEERENVVVAELAGLAGGAATARMIRAAARQQAQELVAQRPLSQLRPHLHAVAAGRAAREALRAAARKDQRGLAEAKRRELFQVAMARAATEARAEVEKGIKAFDPIWKGDKQLGKTKAIGYVHAARAVLARWRLGHGDRTAEQHLAAVAAYDPELHADLQPRVNAATANSRHFRDMTLEEFRDLVVAIDTLWYQAGREARYEATGERQQLNVLAGRLAEADQDNPAVPVLGATGGPTGSEQRRDWMRSIANLATRPEHWFWRKDRGRAGLFTRLIWRPIRDAVNRYTVERTRYTKRVADMLARLRPHLKQGQIEFVDTKGNHLYTFGRGNGGAGHAELVMALLHTGNRGNLIRLLAGRGWGAYDRESGYLDTSHWDAFRKRMIAEGYITPEVMRFVQGVWDLNEELKPLAQKAHRELSGFYFEEVAAVPATIGFADGTVETFRGGYMPAKLDRNARSAARFRSLKELESHFLQQHALTAKGFTKMRAEFFAEPLTLDLGLVPEHIDEVLRYAVLQPVTRDVERLMSHRGLRAALDRTSPGYWDKLVLPWLQRVASQSATSPSNLGRELDALARVARSSAGIAMMMGNVVNAAQQFLGLGAAALRVKPRYLVAAMGRVLAGRRQVYEEIAQASPGFMGERQKGQIYDAVEAVNDIRANRSLVGKAQTWVRRHAYFLQTATQNWVDAIVWQGAYQQAVEAAAKTWTQEEIHREAVQQADAAVRMTQSSFDPTDVARYEVGSPLYKLFTQFSSWFNTMANLNADEFQRVMRLTGAARAGAALEVFFLGFFLPMICSEALTMLMRGQLPEDDEGQVDLAQFSADLFGWGTVRSLGAMVPLLGPNVINPATGWLDQKVWNDRVTSSPVASLIERAGKGTVQAIRTAIDPEKDLSGRNIRDVTTLLGFVFQLPGGAVGRYAGYGMDVATGEVEPTSTADLVRGIVTGTASQGTQR